MTDSEGWNRLGITSLSANDRGAEMSVLGTILMSSDAHATAEALFAIAPASEFWAERTIAEVVEGMWRAGKPLDPQLLLAELSASGLVAKVGGGPHLHDLIERAWNPDHAKFYAEAVHECWRRRSIATAATRALQQMENVGADVGLSALELMGAAEDAISTRTSLDPDPPHDVLDFVQGPSHYDWLVPGLIERLDRVMLVAEEGLAKALAWDTPIPTPKGWRLMAELAPGDEVFGPDGQPTRVVAATGVMLGRPCSEVRFSDGSRIVASDDHLWRTDTLTPGGRRRTGDTLTTAQMRESLWQERSARALRHAIPTAAPLTYPRVDQPLDPYLLGAWLGDGRSKGAEITTADDEIAERIRAAGYPCRRLSGSYAWSLSTGDRRGPRKSRVVTALRDLGVYGDKHIPRAYLEAHVDQRVALLQGLMDTDGTVNVPKARGRGSGSYATYCSTSRRLIEDVYELVTGLGVKTTIRSERAKLDGRDVGPSYRLTFSTSLPVFHLSRKAERLQPPVTRRPSLRYVKAVEPVASVPVRCIQVARADGMYLAGRECVATHNSVVLAQVATALAAGLHPFTQVEVDPKRALVIDCEVSPRQQRRRWKWMLDCAETLGRPLQRGMLRVEPRPDGLDLVGADLAWVKSKIRAASADLVVLGPLYRLHKHDINKEEVARELVGALDEIRIGTNVALLIEGHAGHVRSARGERELRPRGSSLFLGWTELGLALRPVKGDRRIVDVNRWRGDRDARTWPQRLRWGTGLSWPWIECSPDDAHWRWGEQG